jgi:CCR4-NOT transcriptional regulation complex NOT5 subunit
MLNAPTPAMREKYEQEMKKEIKKLQRIRDYFR